MSPIVARYWDPLELRLVGPQSWQLLHEFRFDSAVCGARLIVPAGFITDLASVPRLPFAFWAVGATAQAAAILHDWGYHFHAFPRRQVDALFYEAMTTDGTDVGIPPEPTWRAFLMWTGVRIGGWMPWG